MKAIVHSEYGPPEVLRLTEVDAPVPGDDEVLIRVRAAEVTKSDCEMRGFRFPVWWFWLPLRLAVGVLRPRRGILGGYFAGEVAAVGGNVRGIAVGDAVMCCAGLAFGGYAEYAVLPAKAAMAKKPANMAFADAAAVPLGGLNALHFLQSAEVRAGESVLINGAGGAIGSHAVQLAKAMGAEVTAVDRGDKETGIRAFGADHFIDYTRAPLSAHARRYDVLLDLVPGSSFSECMGVLKPGGRYIAGNARLWTIIRCLIENRAGSRRARFALAPETRERLETLTAMIEAGRVRSIVDTVYPMAQVVEAHQRVEAEQRVGAIVLSVEA